MAINYQSVVAEGLSKQIARSIREAILSGGLQVDERLPTEDELAARFGVSRPTIREALKRLAAQNLIRSQRGPTGGTFVNRPTFEEACGTIFTATTLLASLGEFDLDEIAEARADLERVTCALAARHRDDEDLARLAAELAVQDDETLSDLEFCQSDVRFHRHIAEAAHNRVIAFVMQSVIEALHPAANMTAVRYLDRGVIRRYHRQLFAAIEAQDAEAAAQAIQRQMEYHRETYVRAQEERRKRDAMEEGR